MTARVVRSATLHRASRGLCPIRRVTLGLVLGLALTANAGARERDDARSAIEALNERWIAAYQEGRYGEIPELYTEDALILPRGRPAIAGREALRERLGGLAAGRRVDIDVEIVELEVLERHAWLVSRFAVTYSDPDHPDDPEKQSTEHGRSLIVYRLDDDGRWRIHRDMDSPAPAE